MTPENVRTLRFALNLTAVRLRKTMVAVDHLHDALTKVENTHSVSPQGESTAGAAPAARQGPPAEQAQATNGECEGTAAAHGPQAANDSGIDARANASPSRIKVLDLLQSASKLLCDVNFQAMTEDWQADVMRWLKARRELLGLNKTEPLIAQELDVDLGPVAGWADQKPFAAETYLRSWPDTKPLRFSCSKVLEVGDQCEDVDIGMRSMSGLMEVVAVDREQKLVTTLSDKGTERAQLRVIPAKRLQFVPRTEPNKPLTYRTGEEPMLNDVVDTGGNGHATVVKIGHERFGDFTYRIAHCRLENGEVIVWNVKVLSLVSREIKREPTIADQKTEHWFCLPDDSMATVGDHVRDKTGERFKIVGPSIKDADRVACVSLDRPTGLKVGIKCEDLTLIEREPEKPLLDQYAAETKPGQLEPLVEQTSKDLDEDVQRECATAIAQIAEHVERKRDEALEAVERIKQDDEPKDEIVYGDHVRHKDGRRFVVEHVCKADQTILAKEIGKDQPIWISVEHVTPIKYLGMTLDGTEIYAGDKLWTVTLHEWVFASDQPVRHSRLHDCWVLDCLDQFGEPLAVPIAKLHSEPPKPDDEALGTEAGQPEPTHPVVEAMRQGRLLAGDPRLDHIKPLQTAEEKTAMIEAVLTIHDVLEEVKAANLGEVVSLLRETAEKARKRRGATPVSKRDERRRKSRDTRLKPRRKAAAEPRSVQAKLDRLQSEASQRTKPAKTHGKRAKPAEQATGKRRKPRAK